MNFLLKLLYPLFVFSINSHSFTNGYSIVKTDPESPIYYLLNQGIARKIQNTEAIDVFGFKNHSAILLMDRVTLSQFRKGDPLPEIKYTNYSPDDITRVELLTIYALQEKLITNIYHVCSDYCKNPSVMRWRGGILMAAEFDFVNYEVRFKWLHPPSNSPDTNRALGISSLNFERLNGTKLSCVDPRFDYVDEERFHTFSAVQSVPLSILVMDFAYSNESNSVTFVRSHRILGENPAEKQKNWVLFWHNNTAHFITHFVPFTIVKTHLSQDVPANHIYHATTVSIDKKITLPEWKRYGVLRGGTNVVLIDPDTYLSFFHSFGNIPGNAFSTYFWGAFTFSANPPFRILKYSQVPIVDNMMYTGKWFKSPVGRKGMIDYVVYPSGFYIESNGTIVLSFGKNDKDGFVSHLDYHKLMDSMIDSS